MTGRANLQLRLRLACIGNDFGQWSYNQSIIFFRSRKNRQSTWYRRQGETNRHSNTEMGRSVSAMRQKYSIRRPSCNHVTVRCCCSMECCQGSWCSEIFPQTNDCGQRGSLGRCNNIQWCAMMGFTSLPCSALMHPLRWRCACFSSVCSCKSCSEGLIIFWHARLHANTCSRRYLPTRRYRYAGMERLHSAFWKKCDNCSYLHLRYTGDSIFYQLFHPMKSLFFYIRVIFIHAVPASIEPNQ